MSQRRRYKNPPIDEVFCRVDFPPILKISNESPADFQEKLRTDYPLYSPEIGQEIIAGPFGAGIQQPLNISSTALNVHSFRKYEDKGVVTIAANYFLFSTKKYTDWNDFKKAFFDVFDAFKEIYRPQIFTRVGLAYRDVFVRSRYDLGDKKWTDLINNEFLGPLSKDYVDCETTYSSVCDLGFNDSKERARINVAIVVNNDNKPLEEKERCLFIENDVFIMDRIPPTDARGVLDNLHEFASKLFKAIPTEILEKAMEPIE
ncbi:MAG: TIGR04255 family protein [Methanomassiliicoccaceae archaeon]|jgi:uncharacterized protein (TIGR04255 family)|nr:TIGR04255 family protein [Methanomassiliicoccaceae archaeon]